MTSKIYSYGRQSIEDDDIQAVVHALRSDWLTQGPGVRDFEDALGARFGAKYALAVSNGTAALHLTALALGWKKGDIILTTPITFVASANCALYVGATADFVDIDPSSYVIDVNKLEEKIKQYEAKRTRIKAVVAVDFAGHPCDWTGLRALANKYDFQLVNDHCHAMGAQYKKDPHYAVKFADAAILSFHPVKHITTGEGGAILTNQKELEEKINILRTHGITKDDRLLQHHEGPWYYEMVNLGFNYRITDFQCALGASQLSKLDHFVTKRQNIAQSYDRRFESDHRLVVPHRSRDVSHAYHLYPLLIRFERLSTTKKHLFQTLRDKGIHLQVHYIPVHLQPYYQRLFGYRRGDFPVAEEFYGREVSVPMYPSLTEADLDFIAESLVTSLDHH